MIDSFGIPLFRNAAVGKLAQVGAFRLPGGDRDRLQGPRAQPPLRERRRDGLPCRWTGALYLLKESRGQRRSGSRAPAARGKASLDARVRSLRDIIAGPFQELVPGGWPKRSVKDGRLEPCVRACGSLDIHMAQYEAARLEVRRLSARSRDRDLVLQPVRLPHARRETSRASSSPSARRGSRS